MKFIVAYIALTLLPVSQILSNTIVINEILAINESGIADGFNEFDDWVEVFNNTTDTVDLHGYFISDDLAQPTKFRLDGTGGKLKVKPGGYLVLWADGTPEQGPEHLGFKLSGTGEEVALYTPDLHLVDFVTYEDQQAGISYGRNSKDLEQWLFYTTPTPGAANLTNSTFGIAGPPTFNLKGGVYKSAIAIALTPKNDNDVIYYTLDNSFPDSTDAVYTKPIGLAENTVVRAVAYSHGYFPSPVQSHLYLFNQNYSLPVFAMISDSSNLWGPMGIYSNPQKQSSDWERFCQTQYFIEGGLQMECNAGMRIQGGNSVRMPKKSFRLFFKSEYGNSRLEYPVFGPNNIAAFDNLVIKSGYDDDITTGSGTLLRDAYSAELWKMVGGLSTNSNWAMLYLNKEFWGLYNIRESVNDKFIRDRTGLDDFDLIRFGRDGALLKHGTLDDWERLVGLADSLDFTQASTFHRMAEELDMDYFINLMAFIHCVQYPSWTWGVSTYRENSALGRWRWTIWDTDRAYTDVNWNGFLATQTTTSVYWGNFLPKKLMQNDIFNTMLINRICDLLNSTFVPGNAIAVFDSLYNILKPEMPKEFARWNPNNTYWESNVQSVRSFLDNRPDVLRSQLLSWFALAKIHNLSLDAIGQGTIRINTIETDKFPWQGKYIQDVPIRLTAVPKPGYMFVGWENSSDSNNSISLNLASDTALKAIFKPDTSNPYKKIIINEICYQAPFSRFSDDWAELFNPNPFDVDLSNWVFKDQNDWHAFIIPPKTVLRSQEYLIIAEDFGVFGSAYPLINNLVGSFGFGEQGFGLSVNNDMVRLYNKDLQLVDSVWYQNGYPWPVINQYPGGSIQLTDPFSDNTSFENWKFSPQNLATPGAKNKFDTTAVSVAPPAMNTQFHIFPNPFAYNTSIRFSAIGGSFVEITVFNTNMQLVKTIAKAYLGEGIHEFAWDGTNATGAKLPPGVYLCCIRINNNYLVRKVVLMH